MSKEVEEKSRESDAQLREIYDLRVYVVGGGFQYSQMFFEAGFRGARNVQDADIVCFTGGSDVDPSFYGEDPIPGTNFNTARDQNEAGIFGEALALKKPMVGVCRGAQFLNVMNGGKLWQDVNNHAIHGTHDITDLRDGKVIEGMTSTHHQMMKPADDADIIAVACLATRKKCDGVDEERSIPDNDDVEVVWYPGSQCLCFQPHPEFQHGACRDYFLDLVDNYVMPAC